MTAPRTWAGDLAGAFSPPSDSGSAFGAVVRRRRGRWSRLGWVGLGIVLLFAVVAVAGPTLAPYKPTALVAPTITAPSRQHLLGTNQIGQDLLSQLLVGARVSLLIGLLAGTGAVVLGTLVGVVAGWAGGWVDLGLMRLTDIFLALPRLPLLILVGALAGKSTTTLALSIAALFWPGAARVFRAQVQAMRSRAYLRAAVGFGASQRQVVARHVVPELVPVMAASFVAAGGRAILLQAGLAFLGIANGAHVSWGTTMASAFANQGIFYTKEWLWWLLPPVLAVVLVLLGVSLVELAIEERFQPRLRRHDLVAG